MSTTVKEYFTKAADSQDFTEGNIYKQMVLFALPLFVSQLFQQLYSTVDGIIVNSFLGTEEFAAVSSSGTLIFMMISFFEGLFMGAGVVISKSLGAGDRESVTKAIHTDFALGLTSGILLTVVGLIFVPDFLRWMDTDPDVMPKAVEYFRTLFCGGLFMILYNVCRGIMTSAGDSKRPLLYLIISSCLNVCLDLLFIGALGLGVWSAALATVISQFVSVVLCLSHLLKKGSVVSVDPLKIRFHGDVLKKILHYGLPAAVQNSVIGFANIVVQSHINYFKKFAMAGFGAHNKIEGFAFLPITSFNMALTTFIGQNTGAKKHDRVKKGAIFGILTSVTIAELIGLVYFIFPKVFIGIFIKKSAAEAMAFGVSQVRISALFYGLLAYSHAVAAVLRGAGKAVIPMAVMLSVWCLGRIAYIVLMTHFIPDDIRVIYWAYPITWSVSSIIYFFYYKFSGWNRAG